MKIEQRQALDARAAQMERMYRSGKTLQSIGKHFYLSRQRIKQILSARGVKGYEGGKRVHLENLRKEKLTRKIKELEQAVTSARKLVKDSS